MYDRACENFAASITAVSLTGGHDVFACLVEKSAHSNYPENFGFSLNVVSERSHS